MELNPEVNLHTKGKRIASGVDGAIRELAYRAHVESVHLNWLEDLMTTGQFHIASSIPVSEALSRAGCAITINFEPGHMLTLVLGDLKAL